MTLSVPTRRLFPGISPKAFQHPSDSAATAALASIPLLEMVLKKLSEMGFERRLQQNLLADAIRIGPRQLPDLWQRHLDSLEVLDIERVPELYIVGAGEFNAMAIGTARPMIVMQSGLVSGLGEDELGVVLSHEQGHILAEHLYYGTVLFILQRLIATGLSPLGMLPLRGLVLILLEWQRCTELSSDRAAAIASGDPLLVCRGLMRTAGGGVKGLDLDAFIAQATEYVEHDDLLARPGRFLAEIRRTHPYAVRRVSELTRWVGGGDYDRIRAGNYIRRGEEPPPSEELRKATEHYRERFMEVVERVSGGAQRLADQFSGWLRRDRDSSDEE